MRNAMLPVYSRGRRVPSANRRWKDRWVHWMVRGTGAAAAIHLLLLLLWPRWDIQRQPVDDRLEMVQIQPVTNPGASSGPEEERTITLPNDEEDQGASDGGGLEISELELADLRDRLAYERLDNISPVLTAGSYSRPAAPLPPPLVLDQPDLVLDPTSFIGSDVWPLIRNPSAMIRFLDSGTQVHQTLARVGDGFLVTVALWINEKGAVEWAQVSESSGQPGIDEVALAAFNEVALFRPARDDGGPIPVGVMFTLLFSAR